MSNPNHPPAKAPFAEQLEGTLSPLLRAQEHAGIFLAEIEKERELTGRDDLDELHQVMSEAFRSMLDASMPLRQVAVVVGVYPLRPDGGDAGGNEKRPEQ